MPKKLKLSLAQRRWLFDRVEMNAGLMAPVNSKLNEELRAFKELGALKMYDSMFGNHYYSLTKEGREAIRP